jgi:hypothetical protein
MRAYIGNDLLGCAFPGEYQVFKRLVVQHWFAYLRKPGVITGMF